MQIEHRFLAKTFNFQKFKNTVYTQITACGYLRNLAFCIIMRLFPSIWCNQKMNHTYFY
jgi:hypothetical protein